METPATDFRKVFQSIPGLYLILLPDLTIVAASDLYLQATDMVRGEVVGRPLFDVFPDSPADPEARDAGTLRASLERVMERRQPQTMSPRKYQVHTADGGFEEHYWSPVNAPVLDVEGRVEWIVHAVEDVTELMRLQPQEAGRDGSERDRRRLTDCLRLANAELAENRRSLNLLQSELLHVSRLNELGQMVSALVHEVSQPLTAIGSFLRAGIRLMDQGETAELRSAVVQALGQSDRANGILRRLRDFIQHSQPERRPEALQPVIEEACALSLIGAARHEIDLRLQLDPLTPAVRIDKIQIQQVLVNLIRNATEAMATLAHRVLTIASGPAAGGGALVRVADTGPGIGPEIRSRLFQPFVSSKANGMGVGLSLCRLIVEAHGGQIWVEDGPGGGSVFLFTIPG